MAATAGSGRAVVTLPADTQLLITREFAAPRHLVWRVWTTPELIRRWWAGQRGKVTSVEVDLRVGGRWRYAMVANNGIEVAFHGEYREIVENELLVSTEVFEGHEGAEALDTATFTDTGGGTRLEILVEHATREDRDAHIASGMEDGLQEALDLVEHVAASFG